MLADAQPSCYIHQRMNHIKKRITLYQMGMATNRSSSNWQPVGNPSRVINSAAFANQRADFCRILASNIIKQKNKTMIAFASPLPKINHVRLAAVISALLLFARISFAGVQTTVGYHAEGQESPSFTFTNVPLPSKSDAVTAAKFSIVSGEADANGGGLEKLHDGKVPTEADEPAENFFFAAGTGGGRIQVDLGRARELKQVNTYSWHPTTRGPQVYKLYASEGTMNDFIAKPGKDADLEKCG